MGRRTEGGATLASHFGNAKERVALSAKCGSALVLALGGDGEDGRLPVLSAVADAMDFARGLGWGVNVQAELRQGRSGEQGDKAEYKIDQPLQR